MDKREAARVLQRGGARGRGVEEHLAADSAEELGLLEAYHRASGRGHTVVRALTVIGIRMKTAPLEDEIRRVSSKHVKETVQLVVRSVRPPVRRERPERKSLGGTGQHGPQRGACENVTCSLKLLANQQVDQKKGER